jgi:flavin-dependent dehydrogenase
MSAEIMVVGGGPAGATAAARLALAGREVSVLEREAGPADKVCGEFLSSEACDYLAGHDVDVRALGAAPIRSLRLCRGEHVAEAALPFVAYGLSRRALDEELLVRAARAGAVLRRAARVIDLGRTASGWVARLDTGEHMAAPSVFLATGKHDLRSQRRPAGTQADLVAFKWHLRLSARQTASLAGCVELIFFDGGYAGLQPIDGGRVNLCLVIQRDRLRALGTRREQLLAALTMDTAPLRRRLDGAVSLWSRPMALSPIPYGHVQSQAMGLFRLGDQGVVIPSFTGEGISIALHSAELAAGMYLEGQSAQAFQSQLARDVTAQVRRASVLSAAMIRPTGQAAIELAAQLWPGLMVRTVLGTRLSEKALARARRAADAHRAEL